MKNAFLILLISIFAFRAEACEFAFPENYSLAISPAENAFFSYTGNRSTEDIPVLRVFNCRSLAIANKHLMIGWGPQNDFFSDRQTTYDFSNQYEDRGCSIAGSRFKDVHSTARRKQELQDKWDSLKSCYEISVTEETNMPLNMPAKQPGCEVKRDGLYNMSFNGGYCFVKPGLLSSYIVRFKVKEHCKHFENLAQIGLSYSDLSTTLNFYSSGDATGRSQDLTALISRPVRLTVAPNPKLVSPSDDFGILVPQFPGNYALPDIHAGTPVIQRNGDKTRVQLPLWVDNNCQKKCQGKLCQSVCDYAQPLAGNFELYEKNENEFEFLTSWYDGGTVQPHFQGEIAGLGDDINSDLLQTNKTYRMKVTFDDPKFDFDRLKGQLKTKIERMQQTIPRIQGSWINDLPQITGIQGTQSLPIFSGITSLNFTISNSSHLERANQELRRFLDFKVWPPYFDKICTDKNCKAVDNNYLELMVDFTLEDSFENNLQKVKVLQVSRKSLFLENYQETHPPMPHVSCPTL